MTSLLKFSRLGLCAVAMAAAPAWAQDTHLAESLAPTVESLPSRHASKHQALQHSDLGLSAGEYFSALGLQVATTGAYVGLTMGLLVATQANQNRRDRNAVLIAAGVLAPPILALPSSAIAHRTATQNCPRGRSWGWTYLAGVAGNALVLGAAAAFMTAGWDSRADVFPSMNEVGLAGIFLAGSLVTAGLEVLALNLTDGAQVTAVPLALERGAGLAIVGAF